MADQRVRSAFDCLQLADGGFARVRALFGKMNVLRADRDVGALGCCNHSRQQNRRGKKRDLIAIVSGDERQKSLDKRLGFGRRLVHLPIGLQSVSYVTCCLESSERFYRTET